MKALTSKLQKTAAMYRNDERKVHHGPLSGPNRHRWALLQQVLALVGLLALAYVPLALLLFPAALPTPSATTLAIRTPLCTHSVASVLLLLLSVVGCACCGGCGAQWRCRFMIVVVGCVAVVAVVAHSVAVVLLLLWSVVAVVAVVAHSAGRQ